MDHPASAQSFNQALLFKSKVMHKRPSISKPKPQPPKQASVTQQETKTVLPKPQATRPPSKQQTQRMQTKRQGSVRGAKVPLKNQELQFVPKPTKPRERVKEPERESEADIIRNLRSKQLQWSFVNLLLDKSNQKMKQQAMDDNYDRFLQIMGLKEENEALKKRIFLSQIIETIDTSLHIQYDLLPQIISYMDQIRGKTETLNKKLQNSLNRVLLGPGISIDIPSLKQQLENASLLLQELNSQLEYQGIEEVAQDLQQVCHTMQAQEKEMKSIVSLLRERDNSEIVRKKQKENLEKFVEQL